MNRAKVIGRIFIGVLVLVVIVVIITFASNFAYFLESVEEQEVGIRFSNNQIEAIVGPGVYSDIGLYVRLETVSSTAIFFEVTDPEIITKDKQRIGLIVTGDIFRPGLAEKDIIRALWPIYKDIYLSDDAAKIRVERMAQQAMKQCVGDRNFDDSIIGTSRDDLRVCIDTELSDLADDLGLRIENVVVPEVVLSPDVQTALDAIVQSRLATEKAAQDELKASAEAEAEQAVQEGQIRVEQSRIQEQARQQTTLAQLEQQRLLAQTAVIEAQRQNELAQLETTRAVIEATKANELISAQRDLEINEALAAASIAKALANLAPQQALAELYASNPEYVQLLIIQANASALNSTDKIIFTQEGMTPTLVLPGPGIVPTVETTAVTTPTTTESTETAATPPDTESTTEQNSP
jgi:hypothetical protein